VTVDDAPCFTGRRARVRLRDDRLDGARAAGTMSTVTVSDRPRERVLRVDGMATGS
jgi:hypothetical protein